MENNKKNKFKVFMVLFVLLVLIAGSSYAVWRYNYNGTSNNTISSTDLSFRFLESNKEIVSIDNAVPMSDEDGIKQEGTGNVFDFEVKSKVGATTDVKYIASLEKISVDSGKTALNDSDIKVYIEDFNGNTVLKPTKISELNSYKLFEKLHRHSRDNSEISTKYKLKVWLDSEVDVFSLENKQYKFKINVKTEQKEQDSNQSYKLVYDLDGGTGSISDSTFKVGDKVTITSVVPTKEGYNFLGWSTKKNASSASYKAGNSVTLNDAYDGSVRLYAVWGLTSYNVNVVVKNGSVDGDSTKSVVYKNDVTFNLVPDSDWALGSVTCTNDQSASIDNKVLTVKSVTKKTTCTVNYRTSVTTLFNDGTLIINESTKDRVSNISEHGKVVKDYNAIGDSASYVMTDSSSQPWKDERDSIKSVEIGQNITPTSTAFWFMDLKNMEKGDFTNLDTSNVTDMSYMFAGAGSEVKTFVMDLSKFNTSKVTNMTHVVSSVGYDATTFSIGDLSDWDVSKVTNMSSAFFNLGNSATTWNIGDLSNWNTSSVTNMYYMFYGAGANATKFELDLSKWDVSKVISVWYMFGSAGSNSNEFILDLSGWDLSNLDRMTDMFTYAGSKATTWTVKIPSKTGTYTNTKEKWYGSSESAYAVPASGKYFTLGNNVSVVVQNGSLASGESASKVVGDGGSTTFNLIPSDSNYKDATVSCTNNHTGTFKDNVLTVSNVTSDTTCTVTFASLSTVLYNDGTLILNELSTDRDSNISTHGSVTKEYEAMSDSNSYVFSTNTDVLWAGDSSLVKGVEFGSKIKPVATDVWFSGMDDFASISCYNLDTSETTSMEGMFTSSSHNVQNIIFDLSNFNTGNVTSMVSMFENFGATSVNITLDLSGWNTSKVSNMTSMFKYLGQKNVSTINILGLDNWNVSNVTNTNEMFLGVGMDNGSFINIGDLTKWDTSGIEDMSGMFFDFGNENTKISSIGRLTIPYGAIIDSLVHSPGFVGDFFIDGSMTSDSGVFEGAATVDGAKINLYYDSSDSEAEGMVDKYIEEYGPDSSNKGNIYKVSTTNNNLTVNVVVQDGTLNDDATKEVAYGSSVSFNVVPGDSSLYGSVECENGTVGFIKNNVLTLKDVKNSDTCTVSFGETRTILYENGTLVINELTSKIDEHSSLYGSVANEFEPMSDSNSYVFGSIGERPWDPNLSEIKKVVIGSSIKPLSTASWFESGSALESGDFYNLDTSETTSMGAMFANTGDSPISSDEYHTFILKGLDTWDTSKVTDFGGMFNASGVKAMMWSVGDLSNWDTSSATSMSDMFGVAGRNAIRFSLDLSNWNVSNVTNMHGMFMGVCSGGNNGVCSIDIGDLSNWDTTKVNNMNYMFDTFGGDYSKIKSIGVLSLPDDVAIDYFVRDSRGFNGGFKFNSQYIASYTDAFVNAATSAGSRINLYYNNADVEALVDSYIEEFGPNSSNKGHIYKVAFNS